MNAYLLSFDTERVDRDRFLKTIDALSEISNWYAFFPGSVAVVSEEEIQVVSRAIRTEVPLAPFVITKIERGARAGFLPKSVWEFIQDPQPFHSLAS